MGRAGGVVLALLQVKAVLPQALKAEAAHRGGCSASTVAAPPPPPPTHPYSSIPPARACPPADSAASKLTNGPFSTK